MKYKFLSLAAFALLSIVSCTSEEDIIESRITRVSLELPDFMEENGTRSQINVSATDGINYSWAVGDVLGIFPDEGDQVSFRLTESSLSADGKNATFDGGAWALKNGHIYYSYFPFSYENFTESSSLSAIPVDYTGQSITAWGDTKNAGQYDFLVAGGTSSSGGALSFAFQRLGALLRVKLTLPATATYQDLILSADASVIPVKGKVNLSASEIAYIPQTYASSIHMNLNDISGTKDQVAYVYMMLPPMTLFTQNISLTATLLCSSGTWTYNLCKSGEVASHIPDFKANTIYKRDAVLQGIDPGGEMSDGEEEGGDGVENGHAYVDLGLSVKWATCNVGASSPEEYGGYYAWGETKAYGQFDKSNSNLYDNYGTYTKTYFNWQSYKWSPLGGYTSISKYNTYYSGFGSVKDNKTVLEPEDDAAWVNWGGNWRMPTLAELDELIENCNWTWTNQNGYYGMRLTSKLNGRSIFLPDAGYREAGSLYGNYGYGTYYWSSSLSPKYSDWACCLYFESTLLGWYDSRSRIFGYLVRAVCP